MASLLLYGKLQLILNNIFKFYNKRKGVYREIFLERFDIMFISCVYNFVVSEVNNNIFPFYSHSLTILCYLFTWLATMVTLPLC